MKWCNKVAERMIVLAVKKFKRPVKKSTCKMYKS